MASWANRPGARRYGRRGGDARPLIAVVLLLGLIGFHAYQSWIFKPPSPLIGRPRVLDGDSIEIGGARICLQGIDAPELDQTCIDAAGQIWPCGKAAAHEVRRHVGTRDVRCEPSGFDRYNRILATCFERGGSDVNAWIVRQGWALAYGGARNYRLEQDEAQAAKRGIWAGAFLPPEEWRRRHPRSPQ